MNRKILYIINHPDWFWSHRLPLAVAAKDQGREVHVAVKGAEDIRFAAYGFIAHELPASPFGIMWEIRKLVNEINPEIVHAITLKYSFLTGLALTGLKTKRVFTIAGLGYLFSKRGILLRFLVSPLLKFSFRNAWIIAQNPDDQDLLISKGFAKDCALIKGSGVDLAQFSPEKNNEAEPPLVLMASRLVREKGVAVFITAAKILKNRSVNAKFQIAGGAEDHNPGSISDKEMRKMIANGAVEWLGKVSDMPTLYARASIVVYPSWYREGIPKVLLEAAAMGKAIVTTDHPGCREVVESGENGFLVPTKDPGATADAIEKLLKGSNLRRDMGKRSRARAEEKFDVKLIVRQTLEIYQKL